MNVNFGTAILDLKGNPIKDGESELTLASAVSTAMLAPLQSDQSLTGADKVRMFRIAQKSVDGFTQDVSIEDVAFIKDRVAKVFGALVVGRVYDILEGK